MKTSWMKSMRPTLNSAYIFLRNAYRYRIPTFKAKDFLKKRVMCTEMDTVHWNFEGCRCPLY